MRQLNKNILDLVSKSFEEADKESRTITAREVRLSDGSKVITIHLGPPVTAKNFLFLVEGGKETLREFR